ncbi:hypothetical protein CEV33_4956 [Brucella grignonensis]|uniref:Uncharacterized protein n=1 Tax=Brucella grignonensis TaxID=94627 RepID=A0A256FSP2_9HYPH|nr:hypothetical protein CEV33_4956 [Brucella grignonensis]
MLNVLWQIFDIDCLIVEIQPKEKEVNSGMKESVRCGHQSMGADFGRPGLNQRRSGIRVRLVS